MTTLAPRPSSLAPGFLPDLAAIRAAQVRIAPHVHRTPVLTSDALDAAAGAKLFFKCENFQRIGAFKARGAVNAVFSLSEVQAAKGVVTHSSGNHGAALAYRSEEHTSELQSLAYLVCRLLLEKKKKHKKYKQTNAAGTQLIRHD